MHFDFLFAADGTRLAKTFTATPSGIEKSPYPLVKYFRSERIDVPTLAALTPALQDVAARGGCLLKGLLAQPLYNHSRAGQTRAGAPTDWVLLDADRAEGFQTSQDLLWELFGIQDLDHIAQPSASAWIGAPGLSAHIILRTDQALTADALKIWLKWVNLTCAKLRDQITLTRSQMALRWPLDPTTCQSDKLIYTSPPVLVGVTPQIQGDGIVYVPGTTLTITPQIPNAQQVADKEQALIEALREKAGLEKRRWRYRTVNKEEVVSNPDSMIVSGYKEARGYGYLNLNGGDSWAYYFPLESPEVVRNFKGEPYFLLKDIAPHIYADVTSKLSESNATAEAEVLNNKLKQDELHRWVVISDQTNEYVMVTYEPGVGVTTKAAPKDIIEHWVAQHNLKGPPYTRWHIMTDPSQPAMLVNPNERVINRYRPTAIRRQAAISSSDDPITCPKIIHDLALHAVGDDEEVLGRLWNWLAAIWQLGRKNLTAWVLNGTEGTGKGALFEKVLMPMFGAEYTIQLQSSVLEREFNGYIEGKQLVVFNEVDIAESRNVTQVMNALKEMITDHTIAVRRMRVDHYSTQNFANLILNANSYNPLPVALQDRRFNIAPRQDRKLSEAMNLDLLDAIDEAMLVQFGAFLFQYSVSLRDADTVIETETREQLQMLGLNSIENVVNAIKRGKIGMFLDDRPSNAGDAVLIAGQAFPPYDEFLNEVLTTPDHIVNITRDMLRTIFYVTCGIKTDSPNKFTNMLRQKGLPLKKVYKNGLTTPGLYRMAWKVTDEDRQQWAEIQAHKTKTARLTVVK